MPLSDGVKGALVGGILMAVVTIGLAIGHYYVYEKASLELAQKTAADEAAAKQQAEERVRQQQQQLTTLQNQANELRRQFNIAKDQFISRVTDAVTDGVARIPGGEPNRPVPTNVINTTIIQRARRVVDERDRARVGIRQLTGNLDKVYDELDSDIDDLKKVIDTPPTDPKIIQMLLQKIADKWPTKIKLLEQLALDSLQQIGCPVQLVAQLPAPPTTPTP